MMVSLPTDRVCVIGVGNEFRCDDAAGILVARRIRERGIATVSVREASGEGAALMDLWSGFERVVIIDAVQADTTPGAVYRIAAHEEDVPASFFNYSTHAFSVAEAIALAKSLKTLPPQVVVFGIEGKTFSMGQGISPEVESALADVERQIVSELAPSQSDE